MEPSLLKQTWCLRLMICPCLKVKDLSWRDWNLTLTYSLLPPAESWETWLLDAGQCSLLEPGDLGLDILLGTWSVLVFCCLWVSSLWIIFTHIHHFPPGGSLVSPLWCLANQSPFLRLMGQHCFYQWSRGNLVLYLSWAPLDRLWVCSGSPCKRPDIPAQLYSRSKTKSPQL